MDPDDRLVRRDALLLELAEIMAQIRDPSSTSAERVELLDQMEELHRVVIALGGEATGDC
ncbi:hypothetical protein [Synechococcus sp. 1G10]|uniref:hypothetical protein n=1 Tax=Synechococcus sp. 1G10 TaxID=2025605 RepID=UPI000B9857E1|nr:hypothetical protein [Synechococcus sp. 1G10]